MSEYSPYPTAFVLTLAAVALEGCMPTENVKTAVVFNESNTATVVSTFKDVSGPSTLPRSIGMEKDGIQNTLEQTPFVSEIVYTRTEGTQTTTIHFYIPEGVQALTESQINGIYSFLRNYHSVVTPDEAHIFMVNGSSSGQLEGGGRTYRGNSFNLVFAVVDVGMNEQEKKDVLIRELCEILMYNWMGDGGLKRHDIAVSISHAVYALKQGMDYVAYSRSFSQNEVLTEKQYEQLYNYFFVEPEVSTQPLQNQGLKSSLYALLSFCLVHLRVRTRTPQRRRQFRPLQANGLPTNFPLRNIHEDYPIMQLSNPLHTRTYRQSPLQIGQEWNIIAAGINAKQSGRRR